MQQRTQVISREFPFYGEVHHMCFRTDIKLDLFFQTYRILKENKERYQDRINELASRPQKAAAKQAALLHSEPQGEFFFKITSSDDNISYTEANNSLFFYRFLFFSCRSD